MKEFSFCAAKGQLLLQYTCKYRQAADTTIHLAACAQTCHIHCMAGCILCSMAAQLHGILSPTTRLEASWEDSSIICESKWWTPLSSKLPVWVKTGLCLLLTDWAQIWSLRAAKLYCDRPLSSSSPHSKPKCGQWVSGLPWLRRGETVGIPNNSLVTRPTLASR